MKTCKKCLEEKEFSEFYKRKDTKDGFMKKCKNCIKEDRQIYYINNKEDIDKRHKEYHENNRTKMILKMKEYQADNKIKIIKYRKKHYQDNKNIILLNRKEYYQNNKIAISRRDKEYSSKNKAKISANKKEYTRNNPEKILEHNAKRRADKKICTPPWYKNQQKDIQKLYQEAIDLTRLTRIKHQVDHIFPLVPKDPTHSIGLHVLANLQILTAEENIQKSNMQPEEWEERKRARLN